jgi:hypothetical protein
MRNMNKKGASLSGWTEGAIGAMLILMCLGIVIASLNSQYGKNYDSGFGLPTSTTKTQFDAYQGQLQTGLEGEASTNAISGVSVVSSWGIIKGGISMMWDFLNGQWIRNSVNLLQLGDAGTALGWGLTLLYIFSIGFILIKVLFKVKP